MDMTPRLPERRQPLPASAWGPEAARVAAREAEERFAFAPGTTSAEAFAAYEAPFVEHHRRNVERYAGVFRQVFRELAEVTRTPWL